MNFHLSTHGGQIAGRHGAVAASGCRKPTACSRYPAIWGCSTRSTRSCRFRRTFCRAVRLEPSSSWRAGRGILNYLTQTCNSNLILALRRLRPAFQVCAAPLPTPPRYLLISPPVARRWLLRMVRWARSRCPPPDGRLLSRRLSFNGTGTLVSFLIHPRDPARFSFRCQHRVSDAYAR